MTKTVIKIEDLSKIYRLGEVGTGTISHDLNRWWKMNILGKEDPFAKVGHVNDRTAKAEKGELVAALRDINLEVKEGEVLGIIGKNGAGKSTLLKILSRVTSPSTGSIKVKGRMASLLEVGTGFHPEMTGRENIYMNGTIMGMRRWEIDRQFDAIVDFAGIAKYVDTPVKRYSSGMTVRLGFAIAAHLEPEILIVDEVLAVGDAEFQKKAIGKMQDVSRNDGRTVLFVSHNMGAVSSLCSRAIILKNGMLVNDGKTDEIIEKYLNTNIHNSTTEINFTENVNNIIYFSNAKILNTTPSFELKLTYQVNKQIGCVCAIKIRNQNEVDLFTTLDTDTDLNNFTKEIGEHVKTIEFSTHDFAPGVYYITFSLSDMKSERFDYQEDVLSFEIHSNSELKNFFSGRKGILQKAINWK